MVSSDYKLYAEQIVIAKLLMIRITFRDNYSKAIESYKLLAINIVKYVVWQETPTVHSMSLVSYSTYVESCNHDHTYIYA